MVPGTRFWREELCEGLHTSQASNAWHSYVLFLLIGGKSTLMGNEL